jgi:asparagine synthase (glutamine-hydrolysing)
VCGIGGILRTDGQPIPEEWLDAIDARIAYRGPDGHGRFRDRVEIDDASAPGGAGKRVVEVAFVHRRLSIIDHAGGHQPMVSERGRNDKEGLVAVVFNGCIYNHRELRRELESKGHTFVTDHSDTEVLIHGWREWGKQLTHFLHGMYAFGLWDRSAATLAMARDWFGEKPLFWRIPPGDVPSTIAFASDMAALNTLPLSSNSAGASADARWVGNYLQTGTLTWVPANELPAAAIEPDDTALWVNGEIYEIQGARPDEEHDSVQPHSDFESLIRQAVTRQLEADVPLGVFLSGGIDSSLVAAFARENVTGVRTFAVKMPDPRYDESNFADLVALTLGTDHTTLDVTPTPVNDLIHLVETMGQPFGDSSVLPTYWVSKAVRQSATVALSGDGGDELFIGYDRYVVAPRLVQYWRWMQGVPLSPLYRAHPKSFLHKVARLRDMARDFSSLGLAAMESIFNVRQISELIGHKYQNPRACLRYSDPILGLRDYDLWSYLPNDLLRKVDTASMSCGLEVRCPFLDRDLARAALSAPIEQLMPGGQRKGLLRQIARKYLPKEIVDRPKMGFAIPIGEWFRDDNLPHKGSGMKTLLLDHLNSAEPFGPIQLNRQAVQRFIDEHMSGKRDHGQRLFTLLTLSIWAKQIGKTQSTRRRG